MGRSTSARTPDATDGEAQVKGAHGAAAAVAGAAQGAPWLERVLGRGGMRGNAPPVEWAFAPSVSAKERQLITKVAAMM